MFRHDCPLAVKPASTPWRLLPKQTWRDFYLLLLSAVSLLVVALPSSEVPEGFMNYSVRSLTLLCNISHKILLSTIYCPVTEKVIE
jgi:hypothetical protein